MTGDDMKFTILLNREDNSTTPLKVYQIERTGPLQAGTLGLTLEESKHILAKVQKELVETQLQCYVQEQRICTECGSLLMIKDYHTVCFKSLFGGVSLRVPRIYGCSCEGQETQAHTIKIDGLVNWVSPELEYIQSQLAATTPYVPSAKILALLLPVDVGNAQSTVRRRALRVGQRLDAELQETAGTEQVEHSTADASPVTCDRHGSRLAGGSPAMALGRREHVGEGKGARRNPRLHHKEEEHLKDGAGRGPMRDLKEA